MKANTVQNADCHRYSSDILDWMEETVQGYPVVCTCHILDHFAGNQESSMLGHSPDDFASWLIASS